MSVSATLALLAAAVPAQVLDHSPRFDLVVELEASPRNPLLAVAVREDGQVLRSLDAGASFEESPLLLNDPAAATVDFDHGGVIYVSERTEVVHVSVDSGATWTPRVIPGIGVTDTVWRINGNPHRPLEVWAGDSLGRLLRSTDAGATWSQVAPTSGSSVYYVEFDPVDPNVVSYNDSASVQVTLDGGMTWNPAPFGRTALVLDDYWVSNYVEPTHDGFGFHDFSRSSDRGQSSWDFFSSNFLNSGFYGGMTYDPARPNFFFYAVSVVSSFTNSVDSLFSIDAETGVWTTLLREADWLEVGSVAVPAQEEDRFLVSTRFGPAATLRDGGPIVLARGGHGAVELFGLAVDPTRPEHLVAVTRHHLLETDDAGETWEVVRAPVSYSGVNQTLPSRVLPVQFDDSGRLLLSTYEGQGRIWRRSEGTWRSTDPDPSVVGIPVFTTQRGAPTFMAASGDGSSLSISSDEGMTWSRTLVRLPLASGQDTSVDVQDVHVVPRPGGTPRIVIVADDAGAGWAAAYTDDLGATYTVVATDPAPIQLASSRRYPEQIALGFASVRRVEVSSDGLDTLAPTGSSAVCDQLAIGSLDSGLVVRIRESADPGGDALVIESLDGGASWTIVAGIDARGGTAVTVREGGEGYLVASASGLVERVLAPQVSESFCPQTVPNGAGNFATLRALGSSSIAGSEVRLDARGLPGGAACLFLASESAGFTPQPGGSLGNLCLGGSIGRYAGDVRFASPAGSTELDLDPSSLAQPTGSIPALSGASWFFQAWYRDSLGGAPASHFTDGARVDWID